jgi:inosose dehydratase
MSVRIGTCPDSWGVWFPKDDKQLISWEACLDEMKAAGYNALELGPWGYLPTDPVQLRHELDLRGLQLAAATIMSDLSSVENVTSTIIPIVDEIASLLGDFPGAQTIILMDHTYTDLWSGELISPVELDDVAWQNMINNVRHIRDYALARHGLTVYYHPHGETNVETEAQIERLLADLDIDLCFDTGHHAYAGGDPVVFLEKHIHRIKYLHLKDCDMSVRAQKDREHLSFATAIDRGIMVEAGKGGVDFRAICEILAANQYEGWAIVEHDMYPAPKDKPLPIAKRTLEYLRSAGY